MRAPLIVAITGAIIAGMTVGGLSLAAPVRAADGTGPGPSPSGPPSAAPAEPVTPGEQARRGLDLLMKALEGWVSQFPSYDAPEVTPDGDIIIRRRDRTRPAPVPAPAAPTDGRGAT